MHHFLWQYNCSIPAVALHSQGCLAEKKKINTLQSSPAPPRSDKYCFHIDQMTEDCFTHQGPSATQTTAIMLRVFPYQWHQCCFASVVRWVGCCGVKTQKTVLQDNRCLLEWDCDENLNTRLCVAAKTVLAQPLRLFVSVKFAHDVFN